MKPLSLKAVTIAVAVDCFCVGVPVRKREKSMTFSWLLARDHYREGIWCDANRNSEVVFCYSCFRLWHLIDLGHIAEPWDLHSVQWGSCYVKSLDVEQL